MREIQTAEPGPSATAARLEKESLMLKCLNCFRVATTVGSELRQAVLALVVGLEIDSREIVHRATRAGYPERPIRKLISRILLEAGLRRRKRGAGPKIRPEAVAIAATIRSQYGRRATRLLGAAHRLSKEQDAAALTAIHPAMDQPSLSLVGISKTPLSQSGINVALS
jgi:hypothetical protein